VNGALRAVKLDGKWDEADINLARHRGKSPVTTSAELYHFYRTWESLRRCFEVTFQLNRAAFYS
jgi:hypothetical protein